jgi:hypothetical protein
MEISDFVSALYLVVSRHVRGNNAHQLGHFRIEHALTCHLDNCDLLKKSRVVSKRHEKCPNGLMIGLTVRNVSVHSGTEFCTPESIGE